ncbi:RidA family protein [Flavobacterium sp.]|uniref:RidA family protein n=1 Tax=Flavobacterium sp. TaxID=239 RepID=UPI00374C9A9F
MKHLLFTLFSLCAFSAKSHASSVSTLGEFVYISGQSGGLGKNHILSNSFREQTQIALQNIVTVLESYNLKPENIMKITILIVDHSPEKLKIWNEEIRKVWNNKPFPASTLIPVPKLAIDGMLIEVDAVTFKAK